MNTIEGSTSEKIIKILAVLTLVATLIVGGYRLHEYHIYESIKVVTKKSKAVEYGTANYDVNNLIKEVEGKIVSIKQDVDTNKTGKQEVVLEVKKGNIVKDVSFNVDVVDTTAAGDSFTAALANYLSQDKTLEESIEFAHIVSSMVVMKSGAQSSIPTLTEVNDFISRNGDLWKK